MTQPTSGATVVTNKALGKIVAAAADSVPGTTHTGMGLANPGGRALPRFNVEGNSTTGEATVEAFIAVTWPSPAAAVATAVRRAIEQWVHATTHYTVTSTTVWVAAVVREPGGSRVLRSDLSPIAPAPIDTAIRIKPTTVVAPSVAKPKPLTTVRTSPRFDHARLPSVQRDWSQAALRPVDVAPERELRPVTVADHTGVRGVAAPAEAPLRPVALPAERPLKQVSVVSRGSMRPTGAVSAAPLKAVQLPAETPLKPIGVIAEAPFVPIRVIPGRGLKAARGGHTARSTSSYETRGAQGFSRDHAGSLDVREARGLSGKEVRREGH